ncbi:hypothetical protein WG66_014574 [Moniliophthora roreri]|nr:hypothetical protein WG66_014574 [Moniliophthora roreri]
MTADISSQRTSLKMMGISTGWETQNLGQRTGYWVLVELIEFGGLQNFRGIDDGIFLRYDVGGSVSRNFKGKP